MSPTLRPTIGLEVHVQLATRTRLFSSGPVPNQTQPAAASIDAVAAGHPGTLPVLNDKAVRLAVRAAMALGCTIHTDSRFDRKHYFWPDLPKGFQVTQERHPLATDGLLSVALGDSGHSVHNFHIDRVHMEEDAGSMRHHSDATLVDLSRCGVPLIEVVGAPDIDSPATAEAWARMLHRTLVRAGVTRGRMEHGELRIDANISMAAPGQPLGRRVEIKNLNSFRNLRRALHNEVKRQRRLIGQGQTIPSLTRRWTGTGLQTLRAKEEARDYCWLPEPDLPVLRLNQGECQDARDLLPDVPLSTWLLQQDALMLRAVTQAAPGLSRQETNILVKLDPLRAWVLRVAAELDPDHATIAGRIAVHDLRPIDDLGRLSAEHLVAVTQQLAGQQASHQQAVAALRHAATHGILPVLSGAASDSLEQQVRTAIDQVLAGHPGHVSRWRQGNEGMIGFFMGQLFAHHLQGVDRKYARQLLMDQLQRPEA